MFPFVYYTIFLQTVFVHHLVHQLIKNLQHFLISYDTFLFAHKYLSPRKYHHFQVLPVPTSHPPPEKCRISNSTIHPPPIKSDDPVPGYGIPPDADAYAHYGLPVRSFQ